MDLDPASRDMMIRTIIGEAGGEPPEGQAAVASVILNRLNSGEFGNNIPGIVLAHNQFEPWSRSPRQLMGISQNSPEYQSVGKIVDSVASGQTPDPTGGATYFYSPTMQAAFGRKTPSFAQGQPTAVIGHHNFYAGENGPVGEDLLGEWGTQQPQSSQSYTPVSSGGGVTVSVPSEAAEPDLLGAWKPQAQPATQAPPAQPPVTATVEENPAQWTAQQLAAHQGPGWGDTAARLGLGAFRGVGDVADTLAEGIAGAGRYGANALSSAGVISPETAQNVGNWANTINSGIVTDRNAFNAAAANSPAAQTGRVLGEIAGSGPFVEMAPAGAMVANPVARTMLAGAGAGGVTSALTSSASDEPLANQVAQGALVGGALGPIGYGASALGRGVRNLFFGRLDPETAQLAQTATQGYGIPVAPGQLSSNDLTRRAYSLLQRVPFTGFGAQTAEQQGAFNRAVSNAFGEDTPKITTQTIKDAKDRIGDMFDSVAQRTGNIAADPQFQTAFAQVGHDAQSVLPQSEFTPLTNLARDILGSIDPQTNSFSAETYQALTRKGAPLDRMMQSKDPNLRFYAGQMRDALDDAMQRSAPPDVVQDLIDARSQWKAMRTVEPLAKKATTGDISPALLLGAANKSYSGNGGALGELGRIGQRFLKPMGTSGTAEHLALMRLATAGLGGLGLGGEAYFDPEYFQRDAALTGLALGGGYLGGRVLRSNALARGMISNALGAGGGQPFANLLSRTAPLAAVTYRQNAAGQ